ncbi:UNVERIFIED_CONTAM: hypothetical protein HDU68_009538, partial [Siphonaria sp. JEL0065]
MAPFILPALLNVQKSTENRYSTTNLRSPSFGPDESQCCIFTVITILCSKPAFECDIIYDGSDPSAPPDVLMLQGFPNVRLSDLDPLVKWESADEFNLLKLLECISDLYLKRELARIHEAGLDAVAFDLSTVAHYPNLEYRLWDDGVNAQFNAKFPSLDSSVEPVTVSIKLVYTISAFDNSVSNVERRVEVSNDPNAYFPKLGKEVPLIDVMMELEESVKKNMAEKDELKGKRQRLCLKMKDKFPSQLLEYDNINFDKASFYFELKVAGNKKDAVAAIALFEFFDTKPPRLTLISPIKSRTGKDDDYMADTRIIPIILDMTCPVDQNIEEIQL